jgi:hypothetical protein
MPDPIRGRWTIRPHLQSWPSWSLADGPRPSGPVEVVPVPDEQAIKRVVLLVKAHMLHDRLRESVGDDDEARQRAVKYIAAALEQPDAGP